jgi:SAM-dependent methyltransferase
MTTEMSGFSVGIGFWAVVVLSVLCGPIAGRSRGQHISVSCGDDLRRCPTDFTGLVSRRCSTHWRRTGNLRDDLAARDCPRADLPVQSVTTNLCDPIHDQVHSDANVSAAVAIQTIASSPGQSAGCLVCGGMHAEHRFVQRGYTVFRCTGCGLEFVAPTPSPSELADYYDRSYAVPLERYAGASARNLARITDLERWCPARGRLLELGASYGHSLALARERGWDVVGVELSPAASEHARTHFGLTVFNCDLPDAPLADGTFDAVIGWHVLEHVRNPKDQLLRLAALLKPGGVLGLRVPNIASFGARVAGQWWPWMCPPAHLWFFSSTTLPRLLHACGFEVNEVRTLRGDGNNLYQYALMAAGSRLNDLRLRVTSRGRGRSQSAGRRDRRGATPSSRSSGNQGAEFLAAAPGATPAQQEPSGLLQAWLRFLTRFQPITNALARGTRPLIEPLERRGWGDELLVYARRTTDRSGS